ncbi:SbcC/MukB-like Walker B domain-containing protein [Sporomusa sp. GT1]|uniref:SbcC/MukB-like Walker B domain-containing protein n=1 Tax=Sporomusa sp. GT1 TaxID=1534747 RepID=UPI00166E0062|nr:SbcC/MukB-like Walker B domain-containing protein [Sporomusa sp. GT1]
MTRNEVSRWVPYRIILAGFWNYAYQEFFFEKGNLLLTGENGCGKSTTLNGILPFLLDGKYQKGQMMSAKDGGPANDHLGYLMGEHFRDRQAKDMFAFIEYKRENAESYLTHGIGLKVRVTHTPATGSGKTYRADFLGVLLPESSGHRIGEIEGGGFITVGRYSPKPNGEETYDVDLIERAGTHLAARGAILKKKDEEYAAMVGEAVFGLEPMQHKRYVDYIRRIKFNLVDPKSNQSILQKTVDMLLAFLPSYDSHLVQVAGLLENRDKHAKELGKLRTRHADLAQDYEVSIRYFRHVAHRRGAFLEERRKESTAAERTWMKAKDAMEENAQALVEAEAKITEVQALITVLDDQIARIDSELAEEDLATKHAEADALRDRKQDDLEKVNMNINQEQKSLAEATRQREIACKKRVTADKVLEAKKADATEMAGRLGFANRLAELSVTWDSNVPMFPEDSAFEAVTVGTAKARAALDAHITLTDETDRDVSKVLGTEAALARTEKELVDEETAYDAARGALTEKMTEYATTVDGYVTKAEEWLQDGVDKRYVNDAAASSGAAALAKLDEPPETMNLMRQYLVDAVSDMEEAVDKAFRPRQEELSFAVRKTGEELLAAKRDLTRFEKEYVDLKARELARPPLSKVAVNTLTQLGDDAFLPFYEAVEFKPGLPERVKAAIEAALTGAGILEAVFLKEGAMPPAEGEGFVLSSAMPATHGPSLADIMAVAVPVGKESFRRAAEAFLRGVRIVHAIKKPAAGGRTMVGKDGSWANDTGCGVYPVPDVAVFIGLEARRRTKERLLRQLEIEIADKKCEVSDLSSEKGLAEERLSDATAWRKAMPGDSEMKKALGVYLEAFAARERARARREDASRRVAELHSGFTVLMTKLAAAIERIGYEVPERKGLYQWVRRWRDDRAALSKSVRAMIDAMTDALTSAREDESLRRAEQGCRNRLGKLREMAGEVEQEIARVTKKIADFLARLESPEVKNLAQERAWLSKELKDAGITLGKQQTRKEAAEGQADILKATHDEKLGRKEEAGWLLERAKDLFSKAVRRAFPSGSAEEPWTSKAAAGQSDLTEEPDLSGLKIAVTREKSDWDGVMSASFGESAALTLKGVVDGWSGTKGFVVRGLKDIDLSTALFEASMALTDAQLQAETFDQRIIDELVSGVAIENIAKGISEAERWGKEIDSLVESHSPKNVKFNFYVSKVEKDKEGNPLLRVLSLMGNWARLDDGAVKIVRDYWKRCLNVLRQDCVSIGEAPNSSELYLAKVKEHLGYHNFIRFDFAYTKVGEEQKRMHAKSKIEMSVGQNATCVFMPVFATVDLMFRDKPDAPRLVGLDETFAGIDELNVSNLFDLLHELKISCLMASFYDTFTLSTVRGLSVYRLTTLGGHVFGEHYLWNGHAKTSSSQMPRLQTKMIEDGEIRKAVEVSGSGIYEETA